MGVLGGLESIFRGEGKRTLPITLEPGETERLRAVASKHPGGASVGGDLVLTDRRLVFTPLNVRGVVEVLTWGLGKAGAPDGIAGLPGKVGAMVGDPTATALAAIATVERGNDASLFKPPTIVVTGNDGTRTEIGILATRTTANLAKSNNATRDEVLDAVHEAIGR
jgi:hypothetical protein